MQRSVAFRASFLTDDLDTDDEEDVLIKASRHAVERIHVGDDVDSDDVVADNVSVSSLCVDDVVFDEEKNTALVRAVDSSFHFSRSSIFRRQLSCATTISSSPTISNEEIAVGACPHEAAARAAILVR